MMQRLVVGLVTIAVLLGASHPGKADVDVADEYEIKAAMYINLLKLVDWPSGRRADVSPLVIGVSGSDEMARALEGLAGSKGVAGKIIVKRLSGPTGLEACHSVFLGGGDRKRIQAMVQALARAPVLTVGESDKFIAFGGMIDLKLKDDRVQIEVNLDAAQTAGLNISSRLLRIALVKTGGAL